VGLEAVGHGPALERDNARQGRSGEKVGDIGLSLRRRLHWLARTWGVHRAAGTQPPSSVNLATPQPANATGNRCNMALERLIEARPHGYPE